MSTLKKLLLSVVSIPVLLSSCAYAANTKFVQPGGDVSFAISTTEPNRIAVVDDRITKFIKLSGTFTETNDGVSGDIFITPIEGQPNAVISGFLTTEKGNSIQLRLIPKKMPSTNTELSLKSFSQNKDKAADWERSFNDYRLAALSLARKVGHNEIAPGYATKRYEKAILMKSKSFGNLTVRLSSLSLGSQFLAEKLNVINVTKTDHPLTERMFNDKNVVGVWIEGAMGRQQSKDDSFYLSPNESVTVIRVRKNVIQ